MFNEVGFGAEVKPQAPGFWETLAKKSAEEVAKAGTQALAKKINPPGKQPAPRPPAPPPPAPSVSLWQRYGKIAMVIGGGIAIVWAWNKYATREKEEVLS
jgi:hypothetical protein